MRWILQGRKYVSPFLAEKLADGLASDAGRVPHVSEIEQALSLSVTTLSTYWARILTKMGLKGNTGLTRYALEKQII